MDKGEIKYNRALFEVATIGLALCRMDGELVDVNIAYAQLLGRSVEETLKLNYWDITPKEYSEREQQQLHDLNKKGRYGPYEKEYIHKNGHRIPVRLSGTKVEMQGETFIWSSVEDITDRKNVLEALQKANDNLESRVQERTAELKTYSQKVEQSNRDLEDFAYLASHDLQEPLRKIILFSDRLMEVSNGLDETGKNYLRRMQHAATRMRLLIDNLLEMSRVQPKPGEFKLTDLTGLVKNLLKDMENQINKTQGQVNVGSLPELKVDPAQISQLFNNLISNSLKYHRDGIPPVINLSSLFIENTNCWKLMVEDNGIGFDEKYSDKIFKPFERLHGKSEYEGTGMGLAICEKVVRNLGGKISAQSKIGDGSTFIIFLPEK